MAKMARKLTGGLEKILHDSKGHSLNAAICDGIVKALDSERDIKLQLVQQLLELCIQDPKDDVEYAKSALSVVSTIVRKAVDFTSKPDLLPSMLRIIHLIKTDIYSSKSADIKILFFETLLSFPDEVYLNLDEGYFNEVMEILNLYLHQGIPIDIRVQPINVLHIYLKVLPPDKRTKFVREGIDVWFLKLIPNVMIFASIPNFDLKNSLETLELVTDELIHMHYEDNQNWQIILQCIYTPQKYPSVMKNLLEKGSDSWHRLWIIFIRLLKSQITKVVASFGSPINSMLPVVETAFKMDVCFRCLAFKCWDALIDNFSTETDEVYINKRIKLLLIPLRSNNAKVEDTVLAKLKTWYKLIYCFHNKVKGFSEILLTPFLHFCFGKPVVCNKPVVVPGLLSDRTKEKCLEAFVNILGHYNCEGCVSLLKLNNPVIISTCLIENWKDLIHCMNVAIRVTANSPVKLRKPLKCAWMSFVNAICNLPNEKLGSDDYFIGLLTTLENIIQDSTNDDLTDIVLNDLILTLFDGDANIKKLLTPRGDDSSNFDKIVTILLSPSFEKLFNGYEMAEAVAKLKTFADFAVEHCIHASSMTDFLLKEPPKKYNLLVLWTALTASICENKYDDEKVLCKLLTWPLKHLDLFTNVDFSSALWHRLYDVIHVKYIRTDVDSEILETLKDYENKNSTNYALFLKVLIKILKQKFSQSNGIEYGNEVKLLQHITSTVQNFDDISVYMSIIDILLEITQKLIKDTNLEIAEDVMSVLKTVLSCTHSEFKKSLMSNADLLQNLEELLKSIEKLLKLEAYTPLKQTVANKLFPCVDYVRQHNSLKLSVLSIMEILLSGINSDGPCFNDIKKTLDALKKDSSCIKSTDQSKFTSPKTVTPKKKKKEPSIVNTVVENGEEFVVVKSNWKFNPRKLTDKQKERLQRNRDNIPALYQDLSQSQEEFKLSAWKTDSQDTTTSSKSNSSKTVNCATDDKLTTILKNMPNTDVVPKILQNILPDNNDKNNSCSESKGENINKTQSPVHKEVKTPKLALKDRVFRNVRNLIEKSNNHQFNNKEEKVANNDVIKTPTGMSIKTSSTVVNSAPSDINLDRPSRVKRKPRKFEDLHILTPKRRRHSLGNKDTQNEGSSDNCSDKQDKAEEVDKNTVNVQVASTDNQENEDKPDSQDTQIPEDFIITAEIHQVVGPNKHNCDDKNECQRKHYFDYEKQIDTSSESNVSKKESELLPEGISFNSKDCKESLKNNNDQSDKKSDVKNSSSKKPVKTYKSRIEKELAIDMVDICTASNLLLNGRSQKRITRSESPGFSRRKSLAEKLNKSKIEQKGTPKTSKKIKEKSKDLGKCSETQIIEILTDSQDSKDSQDLSGSQDIIESSQDSTESILSVKTTKTVKRVPIVKLKTLEMKAIAEAQNKEVKRISTEKDQEKESVNDATISIIEEKGDEFPKKSTSEGYLHIDLTEDMDTEVMTSNIVMNKSEKLPKDNYNLHEMETQDMTDVNILTHPKTDKNADVILLTPDQDTQIFDPNSIQRKKHNTDIDKHKCDNDESQLPTQDQSTKSLTDSVGEVDEKADETSSLLLLKDKEQRKQDFLNNTLEISPIKTLSPVRENKSPSPDTSSDYVVIKLSSPVQSNGEPFEKCSSPEVFTEEKISPDKRDQSPPREAPVATTSPSPRSLSLRKNKPQVRTGRAAQMLGLCVPASDRLQTIITSEKPAETEEPKKTMLLSMSAKRNLRILYNSTNESNETSEDSEENEHFLKLKRPLPAADSSPSVPILKRKLADITDDTTVSPASKRKRVSFHDPPVSTTMCVKKYIEPSGVRSPQNSLVKRQERQLRSQLCMNLKSQKRLDNVFKLDKALTNVVASFSDGETPNTNEDTEMSSVEPTPLAEVVKNSELNNVDPICLELIDCKDPIDNIAGELSSLAMKDLLVKEFAGSIETVSDLARMTELEVNRLCIKAPKIQVAKKVLTAYLKKVSTVASEITPSIEIAMNEVADNVEIEQEPVKLAETGSKDLIIPPQTPQTLVEADTKVVTDILPSITGALVEKLDCSEKQLDQIAVPSKEDMTHVSLKQDTANETTLTLPEEYESLKQDIANETAFTLPEEDESLKQDTANETTFTLPEEKESLKQDTANETTFTLPEEKESLKQDTANETTLPLSEENESLKQDTANETTFTLPEEKESLKQDTANETTFTWPEEKESLKQDTANETTLPLSEATNDSIQEPKSLVLVDVEMQTDCVLNDCMEVQTEYSIEEAFTQTDKVCTAHSTIQTDETGSKSTADIVTLLLEKPDFCERLNEQLDLSSKLSIAESLSLDALMDTCIRKVSRKDMLLFCSDLLKKVHNKNT